MTGAKWLAINGLIADPDLELGGYITLERADGRSVWRQRFVVKGKFDHGYVLEAASETDGYFDRPHVGPPVPCR